MQSHGLKAGRRAGSKGQGRGSSRAEAESQLPEGRGGELSLDNTWIMAGRGGGRNARSPLQGALKWGRVARQGWGNPLAHLPPPSPAPKQGNPAAGEANQLGKGKLPGKYSKTRSQCAMSCSTCRPAWPLEEEQGCREDAGLMSPCGR